MATDWVLGFPNIKGFSGHLQHSSLIIAYDAPYALSNKHINIIWLEFVVSFNVFQAENH